MKGIHIGEAIKLKVQERGIRIAEFANAIHCNRTNIYSLFRRKSIDIDQLILISKVLEYDFISELYLKIPSCKKYLVVLEVDKHELQNLFLNPYIKYIKEM
ncbi:MAG: helix-turn-helix domain-containing protein [Lentimicrobiaceae bacterium]|jgi:plasmid maintenance system antidote protein VapI|nr:helix-turn-helix domain-containing protein [Lentimicrobiaceae bacterium]